MKLCYISIVYILTVIWASKHLKDFGHSMILPLRKSQPLSPRPCFAHSRHSQSPLLWFTPRTFLSTQSSLCFQLHYKRKWRQEPHTSKIRMTWTFPFAKRSSPSQRQAPFTTALPIFELIECKSWHSSMKTCRQCKSTNALFPLWTSIWYPVSGSYWRILKSQAATEILSL